MIFWGCSKEPKAIRYNEDNCTRCKMTISDLRYGAEIVTTKGKNYKYDSIECMTADVLTDKASIDIQGIWVIDFNDPGNFIKARDAHYVHSDLLKSPMGLNFSAFSNMETARNVENVFPGEIIKWKDVKMIVKREWLEK
jgi:copper chaperone NosL